MSHKFKFDEVNVNAADEVLWKIPKMHQKFTHFITLDHNDTSTCLLFAKMIIIIFPEYTRAFDIQSQKTEKKKNGIAFGWIFNDNVDAS